jgi:hypothetical protein
MANLWRSGCSFANAAFSAILRFAGSGIFIISIAMAIAEG